MAHRGNPITSSLFNEMGHLVLPKSELRYIYHCLLDASSTLLLALEPKLPVRFCPAHFSSARATYVPFLCGFAQLLASRRTRQSCVAPTTASNAVATSSLDSNLSPETT